MAESFPENGDEKRQQEKELQITEAEVASMRTGDQEVWSEIVTRCNPLLSRVASKYVGMQDAPDIVNEAWTAVFAQFENPEFQPYNLFSYLKTTVASKAIDVLRKNKRLLVVPEDTMTALPNSRIERTPEDLVTTQIVALQALHTIYSSGSVGPLRAQALFLQVVHGSSVKEIAGEQKIPVGTVKANIFHAKRIARDHLRS